MCGILFTNDPNLNKKVFLDALHTMKHRGPDAPGGYVSYKDNQLGYNRLKIIDFHPDLEDIRKKISTFNKEWMK